MSIRLTFGLISFLILACSVAADDPAVKPPADLKPLVGKWTVAKCAIGGKDISEHLRDLKYEILEGGKYTAQLGERKETGTFTIDAKKAPKTIDITAQEGPHKGTTFPGIYELKGDEMRVCYDQEGKVRPTEFATDPGKPTTILMEFKRVKQAR